MNERSKETEWSEIEEVARRHGWSEDVNCTPWAWLDTIVQRRQCWIDQAMAKFDKLERQNARLKELYASVLSVVRRYQDERDVLLDRVKGALLGIRDATDVGLEEGDSELYWCGACRSFHHPNNPTCVRGIDGKT